jgi:hypothetical protein
MLDVEFEWFDPNPEVDFHGLKNLCRQLFDSDAQLFNLSELVDLILSQPTLGSTVKVDGTETDPYAFLTVINLHEHRVSTERISASCRLLIAQRTNLSSRSSPSISDKSLRKFLHLQVCPVSWNLVQENNK